MIDEVLEKKGLKYEDLTPEERETYNTLVDQANKARLTLDALKEGVTRMRESVETTLVDEPEYIYILGFKKLNPKNIFLKARLKNYLLIEAILLAPDRAKAMLERVVGTMVDVKNGA